MWWLSSMASNIVLASLLAAVAWFVQRRLRRHALARILWVLALVKLVTPPLLNVPLVEASATTACALGLCGCEDHAIVPSAWRDVLPWFLLAVWSIGAAATVWTTLRRWTHFRRLTAHARPAPPEWQSLAASLAAELSIRRTPEILEVAARIPPLVLPGLRRPSIMVPRDLMHQLSDSQKTALLLHELVHIKRGDHWVRLLQAMVGTVYWWLPGMGTLGRRLRTCEEASCDAEVIARLPQRRQEYARLLLDVIDFTHPLPRQTAPQATAMSAADDLERRLRAILSASHRMPRRWPTGVFAVVAACVVLPCGLNYSVAIPSMPAGTAIDRQPAGEPTPAAKSAAPPSGNRAFEITSASCCPS